MLMKTIKNYRRFQPANTTVDAQIKQLLLRGGVIVSDNKDFVEIRRLESVAKIDRLGRVEWREFYR